MRRNQRCLKVRIIHSALNIPERPGNDSLWIYFELFVASSLSFLRPDLFRQAPVHHTGLVSRRLSISFMTTAPLGTRPSGSVPGLLPRWPLSTQLRRRLFWPALYARHCTFYPQAHPHFNAIQICFQTLSSAVLFGGIIFKEL